LCASFAKRPRPFVARAAVMFSRFALLGAKSSLAWRIVLGKFFTMSLFSSIRNAIGKVDARVLVVRARELANIDVSSDLAAVKVPILYLKALSDRLVLSKSCKYVISTNSHVEVCEIDAPHFVLQAVPNLAAVETIRFCEQCTRD